LVRPLGRAEPGERLAAVLVANALQRPTRHLQRLFPARFAKHRERIGRVHDEVRALGDTLLANQRPGQALRVMHVVVAIATLDAQALMVRRAVAAFDSYDLVVLDVIVELAADAAVRADGWYDLVGNDQIGVVRRRQGSGRTGLHAFAAGDASRH